MKVKVVGEKKYLFKIASLIWEFSPISDRNLKRNFKEIKEETKSYVDSDVSVFNGKLDFEELAIEVKALVRKIWKIYEF